MLVLNPIVVATSGFLHVIYHFSFLFVVCAFLLKFFCHSILLVTEISNGCEVDGGLGMDAWVKGANCGLWSV